MSKTILRIEEHLTLSPALEEQIGSLIGTSATKEYYSKERKLDVDYQQRADSLLQAYQYLLDSIPREETDLDLKMLRAAAQNLRTIYPFTEKEDYKKLQTDLSEYTAGLVNLLRLYRPEHSAKDLTEWLNKAEQYQIMAGNADNVATLSTVTINGQRLFSLQYDERLPAHYP